MEQKISLKKLVDSQFMTNMTDLEVIKTWFIYNNYEQEGITLMADLSKSKTDKLEKVLGNARLWIPVLPGIFDSLKTEVSEEFALKFTTIANEYLLGMQLSDNLLEWVKETIPKLKTPKTIFRPVLEWLKNEYSIEFKDRIV